MSEFCMPSLGSDMESGTLIEWTVQPGDHVRRGDIVAVVETEKGAIDIEIFEEGEIGALLVEPGTVVPVGTAMARVIIDGVSAAAEKPVAAAPQASVPPERIARPPPPTAPATKPRRRVSPAARKRADELGVDLDGRTGSGPGGAITLADVEQSEEVVKHPAPAHGAAAGRAAMREAIAAAMSRSKREIPHYYLSTTIDMNTALQWLEQENTRRSVSERLLYAVLLVKAVALALKRAPELSGVWRDGAFQPSSAVQAGVAVALRGGGLIAPAIKDSETKDLGTLMADLRDIVRRARSGGLRSSEISDATITITSLGERGVEMIWPVIYPPQVAIIGFGSIVERPWSVNGALTSRRVVNATLAADHRVSDGHRGALFLSELNDLLQNPEAL